MNRDKKHLEIVKQKSDNAGENDEKKFFHRLQINDHETEKNNIHIKK